jgi:hypothetical protein
MLRAAGPLVLLLSSSLVGCGDTGDGGAKVSQQPTSGPAPASTAPAGGGEDQPGGAGDEEPVRTPAAFTVGAGGLRPRTVTVAAFLAVDVAITARDDAHRVTIAAPGGGPVDVPAGRTVHRRLGGLRPRDYALVADTGARATLHVVAGGAPGP